MIGRLLNGVTEIHRRETCLDIISSYSKFSLSFFLSRNPTYHSYHDSIFHKGINSMTQSCFSSTEVS